MKYLFYDCEFASSRGGRNVICEFGYVCTDEKMTILEKGNLIINPKLSGDKWDYYALRHILTRTKTTYEQSPEFFYYYEKIRFLILEADYVFGHAIINDVKSVNYALQRYEYPSIDYTYYNIDKFFSYCYEKKERCNLEVMLEMLGKEKVEGLHDAETDAYITMLVYFGVLEKLQLSTEEVIKLCPDSMGRIENYKIEAVGGGKNHESIKNGNSISSKNVNGKYFRYFIATAKPTCNGDKLKGKKITISLEYEEGHFRQMIKLVQLIADEGGIYTTRASQSNIFVKHEYHYSDGSVQNDCRLNYVNKANQNGAGIEIIDFEELLKILGITENELDDAPFPQEEIKKFRNSQIQKSKNKEACNEINSDNRPLEGLLNNVIPKADGNSGKK